MLAGTRGLVVDVGGLVTAEGSIIYGMPQSGANNEPQSSHKSGRTPSLSAVFGSTGFESRRGYVFNFMLTSSVAMDRRKAGLTRRQGEAARA
jgi:hypothetical protein